MRSSRHTLGFFLQVYVSCFEFFSSYAVGCNPVVVYRIVHIIMEKKEEPISKTSVNMELRYNIQIGGILK